MGTRQVEGFIATDQAEGAGACVYWSLAGSADALVLESELKNAGVPEKLIPRTPTPRIALHRALGELTEKRVLVRPLEERGSYALMYERVNGDELESAQRGSVKLSPIGRPIFNGVSFKGERVVLQAFEHALDELSPTDISAWLPRVAVEFCDGVPLRASGGFYYIPPHGLSRWRAIAAALKLASAHVLYELPTMRTEEATRAILDSLEADATSEAGAIAEALCAGKLGDKARAGRGDKVRAMEAKLGRYEAMLGTKLSSFRDKLVTLRTSLALDALTADASGLANLFGGVSL